MGKVPIKFKCLSILLAMFIVLVEVMFGIGLSLEAVEITCDQSIRGSKRPYGYRNRFSRCEGTYEPVVHAQGLELMSATYDEIDFHSTKDNTALVIIPSLPKYKNKIIHVRAKSLGLRTYYQMDTYLVPGSRFDWPINEVIHPLNLTGDSVGIRGTLQKGDRLLIVPLSIFSKSKSIGSIKKRRLRIIFRSTLPVEKFYWSCEKVTDSNVTSGLHFIDHLKGRVAEAGEPIILWLPDSNQEIQRLEIRLKNTNVKMWRQSSFYIIGAGY